MKALRESTKTSESAVQFYPKKNTTERPASRNAIQGFLIFAAPFQQHAWASSLTGKIAATACKYNRRPTVYYLPQSLVGDLYLPSGNKENITLTAAFPYFPLLSAGRGTVMLCCSDPGINNWKFSIISSSRKGRTQTLCITSCFQSVKWAASATGGPVAAIMPA